MEDWRKIWIILFVIAIFILKLIWDKIREKIVICSPGLMSIIVIAFWIMFMI